MEEQPHEEKPAKQPEARLEDSNSKTPAVTEKKKSWFSFGSGQKKPDKKPENKEKVVSKDAVIVESSNPPNPQAANQIPYKEPAAVDSAPSLTNPSPIDKAEKKKSRFGFGSKEKKSESKSVTPTEPVIKPTIVPSNQLPARPQKKKSRFGFGSKEKKLKSKAVRPVLQPQTNRVPGQVTTQNTGNRALATTQQAIQKPKKKSLFSFGSKQKKVIALQRPPQELVRVPGNKVLIPSFEEFERTKNIAYSVRDPFQYTNLVEQDGEIVYRSIEPQLTKREKLIHKKILTAYDLLVNVGTVLIDVQDRVRFVEETYKEIIDIYNIKMAPVEYQRILYFVERDYIRYGKADLLINDRFIEDISCNGPGSPVFVYHRFFESIRTNVVFEELELNNFILRLAQLSGRHISILQPIRDAALPDGSRVNMTLGKEVTKKGSTFTIRKFRAEPISPIEIASLRTATTSMLAFLWLLVEYEQSFLISGGTASGKTTLLNAISMLIRPENKIVSVEDTPEINLAHPNWIQAVTRVGFGESSGGSVSGISGLSGVSSRGKSAGDITLYDLLIAALRQRPDYIIVGEVRGEEAYTLFQAISVGHAAMGTVHAASMVELIARIESMPMNVPRVLVANLDIVIFLAAIRRGEEKVRRVREIVEILGIDPGTKELITNTVFKWDPITDNVEYLGRSFIVEKISKSFGIPKETLDQEIEKRRLMLDDLKNRGVVNYKDVTEAVRQYYLAREAIEVELNAGRKLREKGTVEGNAMKNL